MRNAYLLVAVNKGWVDGYYFDANTAESVWAHLDETYPTDGWVLTKLESASVKLPNNTFHTYARDKQNGNA